MPLYHVRCDIKDNSCGRQCLRGAGNTLALTLSPGYLGIHRRAVAVTDTELNSILLTTQKPIFGTQALVRVKSSLFRGHSEKMKELLSSKIHFNSREKRVFMRKKGGQWGNGQESSVLSCASRLITMLSCTDVFQSLQFKHSCDYKWPLSPRLISMIL